MRTDPRLEGPDPDLPLVKRFRRGDEAAFDEIVLRHQGEVYRLLRVLVGAHEDADDLAQEVFLKVWQRLPGFEERAALRTWITRIAINMAMTHRDSGWRKHRAETPVEPAGARTGTGVHGPLDVLLRDEERRVLEGAIRGLPERQRETLRLVVDGRMKYAEIAEAMGCSEGTVKANFFHAVRSLRRTLTSGGEAGERGEGARS